MQDMSQLNLSGAPAGARAGSRATAEDVRREVMSTGGVAEEVTPAMVGSAGGKPLPPIVDPHSTQGRQRVAAESREHVQKAIAHLNAYVQSIQRDLQFFVDEGSGRSIVQVIDRSTREVVRQIPSDVALRLARNLKVQQAQYASDAGVAVNSAAAGLTLIDTRI
jgi:flagellar protein FlaG